MPREQKKRGRREQQKRKRDEDHGDFSPKRQRVASEDQSMHDAELEVQGEAGDDFISFGFNANEPASDAQQHQNQFYGLLEPEEQEYYASVNNKISANDFESDEDRALFIEAVHRETQGKEMKVASSQSCSRYLEKVIMLSTAEQLKPLFTGFLENLEYLVQHRFGSHCCETLFAQAANFIDVKHEDSDLESLYLQAVERLEPNIGFLLTERFASHTIRVLLLVLSGEPLDDEATKSMVASRRKEKLDIPQDTEESTHKRKTPQKFQTALWHLVGVLLSSIDTTYLRALATHPTGNPVLQLLLRLELTASGKVKPKAEQSLLSKLIPDEELDAESESGKFILGLMYDPTGSHLVETMVQYLPGKLFKKLYKNILKERMKTLSKNDVASYVAIKVLERLGKDDLAEASNDIMQEIPGLINRSRTGLIKILFERCAVRHVDTKALAEAVRNAYGADEVTFLPKILRFHASIEDLASQIASEGDGKPAVSPYKADVHGSLLAQTMLQTPTACIPIQQSILAQPTPTLLSMSKNPVASRVIQSALTSPQSQPQFRRQLVPKFYGYMTELAKDQAGSHVADALWDGTSALHFMKEKLAKELQGDETALRNSIYGRSVWKNWSMDTYTRHIREWQALAKGQEQEAPKNGDEDNKKTPIQLARLRHAEKRVRAGNGNGNVTHD